MDDYQKEQAKALGEVTKETLSDVVKPSAATIGQAISSVLYRAFGDRIFEDEINRVKRRACIQALSERCDEYMRQVPIEKLMFPKKQVLLGAAFDSEFVLEEETLRDLFAKLLANASNTDKVDTVHPSFSHIIRTITPHDAVVLSHLRETGRAPVAHFVCNLRDSGGSIVAIDHILHPEDTPETQQKDAVSLDCLAAHKLIDVTYLSHLVRANAYDGFAAIEKQLCASIPAYAESITMKKGIAELTSFGQAFCAATM